MQRYFFEVCLYVKKSSVLPLNQSSVLVVVLSLNSVFSNSRPSFIKIDTELRDGSCLKNSGFHTVNRGKLTNMIAVH